MGLLTSYKFDECYNGSVSSAGGSGAIMRIDIRVNAGVTLPIKIKAGNNGESGYSKYGDPSTDGGSSYVKIPAAGLTFVAGGGKHRRAAKKGGPGGDGGSYQIKSGSDDVTAAYAVADKEVAFTGGHVTIKTFFNGNTGGFYEYHHSGTTSAAGAHIASTPQFFGYPHGSSCTVSSSHGGFVGEVTPRYHGAVIIYKTS